MGHRQKYEEKINDACTRQLSGKNLSGGCVALHRPHGFTRVLNERPTTVKIPADNHQQISWDIILICYNISGYCERLVDN